MAISRGQMKEQIMKKPMKKTMKKPVRLAKGAEVKKVGLTPAQVSKKFDDLKKGRLTSSQVMRFILGKLK
jgi:hypothetical protein